jgi:hypothetical protein
VFTAGMLGDALAELGQMAHDAGRVIDVAVYGASCLKGTSQARNATRPAVSCPRPWTGVAERHSRKPESGGHYPRPVCWISNALG